MRLSHHLPERVVGFKVIHYRALEQRLWKQMPDILFGKRRQLENISYTLQTLSPLQTLSRGFSSLQTTDEKNLINSINQVKPGDSIKANLQDGQLLCTINKVVRTSNE
jgi:exodeoxyribonuclease VII large subunit